MQLIKFMYQLESPKTNVPIRGIGFSHVTHKCLLNFTLNFALD
jgi:hypothetical protein